MGVQVPARKLPYATQNKAMTLVVHARPAVGVWVAGVRQQQVIAESRIHSDGFGIVINCLAECIGAGNPEVMREVPGGLHDESMIDGTGGALHEQDAVESCDGSGPGEPIVSEHFRS